MAPNKSAPSQVDHLNALVTLMRSHAKPCRNCKHKVGYRHGLLVGVNSCLVFFEKNYKALERWRLSEANTLLAKLEFRFSERVSSGFAHYVRMDGQITQKALDEVMSQPKGGVGIHSSAGEPILSADRLRRMVETLQGRATRCRPRNRGCNHEFPGSHGVVNGHGPTILALAFPELKRSQVDALAKLLARFGFIRRGRYWIVSLAKVEPEAIRAHLTVRRLVLNRARRGR